MNNISHTVLNINFIIKLQCTFEVIEIEFPPFTGGLHDVEVFCIETPNV